MYLTFADYQALGGTISDVLEYNMIEFEVESIINYYTFNRLCNQTEYPESLKYCTFLIIQLLVSKYNALSVNLSGESSDDSANQRIVSESNDDVSVTYATIPANDLITSNKAEIKSIINQCLRSTVNELGRNLLYRGYYPGE